MDGGGKKLWIIANWKSNKTISEALNWLSEVGPNLSQSENIKVIVCPPFSDIPDLKKEIESKNYPIILGSQDLSPFGTGAYTGEEPGALMRDLVSFSILGHSERRENFGETDEMVAQKFNQCTESGIEPVVCVQGEDTPVPENCEIAAYEPVFAIGTGTPDTPENAQKVSEEIKSKNPQASILYGGSVNAENCAEFVTQKDISGLLIGKASLDPQEFLKIIQNCATV